MADEFDRRIMPDILQTTLTVSLGAAYKGMEMLKSPSESLPKMVAEMKTLLSVPEDAGDGIQQKFEALAGVWLEKGTNIVAECKTAGEKFTEGG
jgi:hypothetical protein